MRLNNWSVCYSDANPYLAPELRRIYLHGQVYENPSFVDGSWVTTSAIVGTREDRVVTMSGSEYLLKEPSPEYESIYPNAKARLFSIIKEKHDV